jgi:dihydrofolate reductase
MAKRPIVSLVVAVARNGVIGRDNDLPWRLPDDLKHFKAITLGKPVVMGRKTFESIGRPLPGRENRVVSHRSGFEAPGCRVFASLEEALSGPEPEVMVIGGGQIYTAALPLAQRLYITEVDAEVDGDAKFPGIDPEGWREVSCEAHGADERHAHALRFRLLERIDP